LGAVKSLLQTRHKSLFVQEEHKESSNMMHQRLFVLLVLLVALCVDARQSRFAKHWRDRKGLRGRGKNKPEPAAEVKPEPAAEVIPETAVAMPKPAAAMPKPETAVAMPKPAAAMPKPATATESEIEEKMSAEKQTASNLPTKIGDAIPASSSRGANPVKPEVASAMPPPKIVKEPPVKGAGMPPPNMGMYHAMGPPGMGPPPGMGGRADDSAPLSIVGAAAYAGFWCGPKSKPEYDGLPWVEENCRKLPLCKYKTVPDGAAGKVVKPELVDGQEEPCMRRCDPKDGLSEDFCDEGQECYPYVLGCPCANLNSGDKKCQAW
jgi:hypothetical protein